MPFERLRGLARSSPRQTFWLFPLGLLLIETLNSRGRPRLDLRSAPLLVWGFGQYWLCGHYRAIHRAGGRGFKNPPARLLTDGPYAYTRNPMYLGHLLFALGLALVVRSPLGWLLLMERCWRFQRRVLEDEARLMEQFGEPYLAYLKRVRRWLPGLL